MGDDLLLRRIALTEEDTRAPALRPARFSVHGKAKDARYGWFLEHHGEWCWELDAMSPVTLRARVEALVEAQISDWDAWERAEVAQEAERSSLVEMLTKWTATLNGGAAAGG